MENNENCGSPDGQGAGVRLHPTIGDTSMRFIPIIEDTNLITSSLSCSRVTGKIVNDTFKGIPLEVYLKL